MLKVVKTEYGTVRGTSAADPRIIAFRGIPFAAPPVGDLRWHAPVPPECWDGVRDCLEFAPISMQGTPGVDRDQLYSREWHVDPDIPMSEDCLYLNVWTPAESEDDNLPVYVWYFGGGLQCGYTSEMEFDGERIARRGVVVVTINYRVNVFGFFAHPEITKEAPEAPSNFGHLDQREGLLWTYRNIKAFGGNPDNITIGGQSAGGMSVMAQLNFPGNAPYIKGAIVESGIFLNPIGHQGLRTASLTDAEATGERFFQHIGVESLREARAMPAREILSKMHGFRGFFGTVADGVFQSDSYWANIKRGQILDVPMMVGHTNNEFFSSIRAESIAELEAFARENFGNDANELLSVLDIKEGDSISERTKVGMIEFAFRYMNKKLRDKGYSSPHYYYEFGAEIPGFDTPGAFHSVDLWFFFETLAKCWRPFKGHHYDLARQMCNYWCNFIGNGDPNGKDADGEPQERWEPYTEENGALMEFYSMPKLTERKPDGLMQFLLDKR